MEPGWLMISWKKGVLRNFGELKLGLPVESPESFSYRTQVDKEIDKSRKNHQV